MEENSRIGIKARPLIPSLIPLDRLHLAWLYTCDLAKILQNGVKVIQKLTRGFRNHAENLDNFREAVESSKS